MNPVGTISIRPLSELVDKEDSTEPPETPKKTSKRKAATTSKKRIHNVVATPTLTASVTVTTTTEVKKSRSSRKDPLPGQLRIDSFYNSATKTYKIEAKELPSVGGTTDKKAVKQKGTPKKPKRRRKALFKDDDSSTTVSDDKSWVCTLRRRKTRIKAECVIDLCSEGEAEKQEIESKTQSGDGVVSNNEMDNSALKETSTTTRFKHGTNTIGAGYVTTLQSITEIVQQNEIEAQAKSLSMEEKASSVSPQQHLVPKTSSCHITPEKRASGRQATASKSNKGEEKKGEETTEAEQTNENTKQGSASDSPASKDASCDYKFLEIEKMALRSTRKLRLSLGPSKKDKLQKTSETENPKRTNSSASGGLAATSDPKKTSCTDDSAELDHNVTRRLRSSLRSVEKSAKEQTSEKSRTKVVTKNCFTQNSVSNKQFSTESINLCQTNETTKLDSKEILRKNSVLSPSDSNTSRSERSVNKLSSVPSADSSHSKKHKSTEPPTSPESLEKLASFEGVKLMPTPTKSEILARVESSFSADIILISDEERENTNLAKQTRTKNRGKRAVKPQKTRVKKPRPCPPYKVVEGTTFAVDAFRYGDIEGVTHYFLTHFHADHYIGLNRKFAHELYMSTVTARLLRVFIPIDEQYVKELALNEAVIINDVEVTAIDANHCPGAIMLIFKTREGRCILHTGDFRACAEMESEPIFWNNDIHTIYLDTTYLPNKYAFCAQSDSIDRGLHMTREFHEKNVGTRILFVCGSYLIGKEKFWSTIAHTLSLNVWVDVGRRKALEAIKDENILSLLVDDPYLAHMHVIPMVHLSYFTLVDYIDKYSTHFDVLFALRPSGWEKDSKPQFRGKVNIVGIEYSEHSSHDELKRFVQYLKPEKVISTVPVSHDLAITAKIPENWYKYGTLTGLQHKFQPSITSYFKLKNAQVLATPPVTQKSTPASSSSGQANQMIVSPIKQSGCIEPNEVKTEKKCPIVNTEEEDDWLI